VFGRKKKKKKKGIEVVEYVAELIKKYKERYHIYK